MDDTFIDVPCGAQIIMDILEGNGYEAYVVGGCVRDFLIGRKASDWDICTDASPEEMKVCFAGKQDISFAENGIKHGTLTVIIHDAEGKHQVYEVTTYRVDGRYTDNRRPETVSFTKDITKDLSRRDFTVNAMAWNAKEGLTDIFGGRKDLEDKIIRCVGKPERRFSEDALRIMRASRFSSQLGFGIEDETFAAMNEKKKLLHNISAERVRIEFIKMLCGEGIIEAADRSREILAEVMPEIRPMFGLDQETRYHIYDVWMHTLHVVKNVKTDGPYADAAILKTAAFFHDIGKPATKVLDEEGNGHFYKHEVLSCSTCSDIMKRLKFDNRTHDAVTELIKNHSIVFAPGTNQARRMLHRLGEERLFQLIELESADVSSQSPECLEIRYKNVMDFKNDVEKIIADESCFSLKDLSVDGKDILDAGVPRGPKIGNILSGLLESVMDGKLENKRDVLLEEIGKIAINVRKQ